MPEELGTQVSVELAGSWQVLAAGMLQVLLGAEQVFVTAVQRLSVCMLHTPPGNTQTFGEPVHRLGGGSMQLPQGQSPAFVQERPSLHPPSQSFVVYDVQDAWGPQGSPLY
jgi:hypothetical protein